MSFNVGDVVCYTNPHTHTIYTGEVTEVVPNSLHFRIRIYGFNSPVSVDGTYLVPSTQLTLLVQTPFTQPTVRTFTIPHEIDTTHNTFMENVNKTLNPLDIACKHEFKTYTGLTKKYEYCTKCNVKKNERGAYEN